MKEILCRAQRKDNGEWTEGYVFELQPGQYMICDRKQYDRPSTLPVWEFFRHCSHEVIPETICRYLFQENDQETTRSPRDHHEIAAENVVAGNGIRLDMRMVRTQMSLPKF